MPPLNAFHRLSGSRSLSTLGPSQDFEALGLLRRDHGDRWPRLPRWVLTLDHRLTNSLAPGTKERRSVPQSREGKRRGAELAVPSKVAISARNGVAVVEPWLKQHHWRAGRSDHGCGPDVVEATLGLAGRTARGASFGCDGDGEGVEDCELLAGSAPALYREPVVADQFPGPGWAVDLTGRCECPGMPVHGLLAL